MIYRVMGLVALLAGLVAGYVAWADYEQGLGEQRAVLRYDAALKKQKGEAAELLALETAKASAASLALADFHKQQEALDAQNKQIVAGLGDQLRALSGFGAAGSGGGGGVRAAVRLRDPQASPAGCGRSGAGSPGNDAARAGAGTADDAEAGRLLSAGISELFIRLTAEADAVNVAYLACRSDAIRLRGDAGS